MPNYKNIIPYLGQRRDKELKGSEEYQLINLAGAWNYTPEKVKKLKEMFEAGKIKSLPKESSGNYYWMTVDKNPAWDCVWREDDLPSVEKIESSEYIQEWHQKNSSNPERKFGPATIRYDSKHNPTYYDWQGGGVTIVADIKNGKYTISRRNASKEEYLAAIKKYYPEAKTIYEL